MTLRLFAAMLVVAVATSGCASISKKDCLAGDWGGLGFEDGAKGQSATYFGEHVDACAKVDVVPERSTYDRGYQQGLLQYCTPEKGYEEGARDGNYLGVCPAETQTVFLKQYLEGLDAKLFRLDLDYESARSGLESSRVERASLGEQEVSKRLRRSIENGESRVSSINEQRLSIRSKISRWRREL